jgi:hypothetical protein
MSNSRVPSHDFSLEGDVIVFTIEMPTHKPEQTKNEYKWETSQPFNMNIMTYLLTAGPVEP